MKCGTLETTIGDDLPVTVEYSYNEALAPCRTSPSEGPEIKIDYALVNGCNFEMCLNDKIMIELRAEIADCI